MGLAGELATSWGQPPWKKGEALQSCVLLFRRWQKQMRATASESPNSKIREIAANFIDRFGDSRFSNIEAGRGEVEPETRVLDRAGYWKDEPLPGVTITSPAALFIPKKSAAAWPWFDRKWNGLASGQPFAASSSRRPVASLLPSLTKIAS